ncbi:hypothetical protein NDU88_005760, partial [Pleurodeles waltl]
DGERPIRQGSLPWEGQIRWGATHQARVAPLGGQIRWGATHQAKVAPLGDK